MGNLAESLTIKINAQKEKLVRLKEKETKVKSAFDATIALIAELEKQLTDEQTKA